MGLKIKININGRAYNSLEEVPEELRKLIDSDGDGVPDVVQRNPPVKGADTKVTQEELRAGIRALLADQDGNGLPDVVQKRGPAVTRVTTTISRTYTVNGKTYHSVEEMPVETRTAIENAGLGRGGASRPAAAPRKGDGWEAGPDGAGPRAIGPDSGFSIKGFFKRLFGRK